ncbi:MAG: hypothetical protein ORN49_06130, partial [Rhodobacteraceae bacterium]|nr:hypothetical protein [Paracoccaceae bacterium]
MSVCSEWCNMDGKFDPALGRLRIVSITGVYAVCGTQDILAVLRRPQFIPFFLVWFAANAYLIPLPIAGYTGFAKLCLLWGVISCILFACYVASMTVFITLAQR